MEREERDSAYLWDMREAARDVMEFVRGVTYSSFSEDKALRYAVERRLEVLGEAAGRVSESWKGAHPGIPWHQIAGLRDILTYGSGELPVDRLWIVANESVPMLVEWLNGLVPVIEPE